MRRYRDDDIVSTFVKAIARSKFYGKDTVQGKERANIISKFLNNGLKSYLKHDLTNAQMNASQTYRFAYNASDPGAGGFRLNELQNMCNELVNKLKANKNVFSNIGDY